MLATLGTLFRSPTRIRVLAYVVRAHVPVTAIEVAKGVRAPRAKVSTELLALTKSGIVIMRPPRKVPRFLISEAHPLVPHLRELLIEAMNPNDRDILAAFRGVSGLLFLVVAGVLAHDERGSVDLLIVSRNPHSSKVPRAVARVERLAGLTLRYSVMDLEEYQKRRQSFDRMLRDVLDFSHRILVMRLPEGLQNPLA